MSLCYQFVRGLNLHGLSWDTALCVLEIVTDDNRHFWRACLVSRGSKKRRVLLKWQRYRLFLSKELGSVQVRWRYLCRNDKYCRWNVVCPSRWNECGITVEIIKTTGAASFRVVGGSQRRNGKDYRLFGVNLRIV
jgi:hypothetical protein